ncbi:MAG: RNA polymerase sigma factor [Gemmatimonadaceae bacterium]
MDGNTGAPGIQDHSFEALALPQLEAVARFALSLTRDRADAEDLVQETFLRAFRHWDTFIVGKDPRRWLFTITRNVFVRQRRAAGLIVESDDGDIDALPSVVSHVAAMRSGLGALFDELDVGPAIARAVDALPEPHRSVILLVDVEGQSYGEAAAILEIPVGTVRSRLFRARRAVQGELIAFAEDAGLGGRRNPHMGGTDEVR